MQQLFLGRCRDLVHLIEPGIQGRRQAVNATALARRIVAFKHDHQRDSLARGAAGQFRQAGLRLGQAFNIVALL